MQRRTLKLLTTQGEREIYDVLLDIVADELLEWDGHLGDASTLYGEASARSFAVARLCLAFDSVAKRAKCALRLKINREFPEEGLRLSTEGLASGITCEEFVERWSTPLQHLEDGPVNAAALDWLQDTTFRDERLNWQFKLPGRPVRILTTGQQQRLPGLIETQALPRSQSFYLLYYNEVSGTLVPWLQEDCRSVREFGNVEGLPAGWKIVAVKEAVRDSIKQQFPFLSFSNGRRISFSGGLRASAGNTFFNFAPPVITLDGTDGTERVSCNGQPLAPMASDPIRYQLPRNLPTATRILIEVNAGDSIVRRFVLPSRGFHLETARPDSDVQPMGCPFRGYT